MKYYSYARLMWAKFYAILGIASSSLCYGEFTASGTESDLFIRQAQASHFLSQASMGGTVQEVTDLAERIAVIGHIPACEEWIDAQLAMPRDETLLDVCNAMALTDSANSNVTVYHGWWNRALNAPDQLRVRMAWALSQIFVVSDNFWQGLDNRAFRWRGQVLYYDLLADHAFTSHREVLQDITYHSMMGSFLTYVSNAKADPIINSIPDQNYAREVMQLFSVGIFAQDESGTNILDFNNVPVENYNQDHIEQFANVFTGLTIDDQRDFFSKSNSLISPDSPMVLYEEYHDTTEKRLLDGVVLPAGQSGHQDVSDALDNISFHRSTAPYFSQLLMKRLTSSNPSPTYVKRVTDAWYGSGPYGTETIGDFGAVLKAILLDPEARNAIIFEQREGITRSAPEDPLRGKVKEPILRMTQFYRFAQPFIANIPQGDGILRISEMAQTSGNL